MLKQICFQLGAWKTSSSIWNGKTSRVKMIQCEKRGFQWTIKKREIETKDPSNRRESLVDGRISKVGLGDMMNRNVTLEEKERINQTGNQIKKPLLPKKSTFQMRNNIDEELLIKRREKGLYQTALDPYNPSTTPSTESSEVQRKMAPLDMSLPQVRTRKVEVKTLENGKTVEIASGNGSRKTSCATVAITPGVGLITINDKPLSEYFIRVTSRELVLEPLVLTHTLARFDIEAKVWGGGLSGQAGAIQLAISRALQNWEPFNRPVLKQAKMLSRDPRKVERKKYGQKKARKKFQWVKR